MTLLSHYYVSQADEKQSAAVALDWYEELKELPAWALANACRWWLSADNENRRKKPLPGDISTRAYHEMGFVRIAGHLVNRFDLKGPETAPEPEKIIRPEDQEKCLEIIQNIKETLASSAEEKTESGFQNYRTSTDDMGRDAAVTLPNEEVIND